LNATAIPGFFKYPGLVVEKARVSGSGKPGLETLLLVIICLPEKFRRQSCAIWQNNNLLCLWIIY